MSRKENFSSPQEYNEAINKHLRRANRISAVKWGMVTGLGFAALPGGVPLVPASIVLTPPILITQRWEAWHNKRAAELAKERDLKTEAWDKSRENLLKRATLINAHSHVDMAVAEVVTAKLGEFLVGLALKVPLFELHLAFLVGKVFLIGAPVEFAVFNFIGSEIANRQRMKALWPERERMKRERRKNLFERIDDRVLSQRGIGRMEAVNRARRKVSSIISRR